MDVQYKATYVDGSEEIITVRVRSAATHETHSRALNTGMSRALVIARQPLGNGSVREISCLAFWRVMDR